MQAAIGQAGRTVTRVERLARARAIALLLVLLLVSGCAVVEDREPATAFTDEQIAVAMPIDLLEAGPALLAAIELACPGASSPLFSESCSTYVDDSCVAAGYAAGYGARSGDTLERTCVRATSAQPRRVEFSEALSECDLGCSGPTCDFIPALCVVAVDQYCAAQPGFVGGFGPLLRDASGVDVACLRSKVSGVDTVQAMALSGCEALLGAGGLRESCRVAISDHCAVTPGIAGGFGPITMPDVGGEFEVACLLSDEFFERNAGDPVSPALPIDVQAVDLLRDEQGALILDSYGLPQYRESHSDHSHLKGSRSKSNDGRLFGGPIYADGSEDPTGQYLALGIPEKLDHDLGLPLPGGVSSVAAYSDEADRVELDMDAIYGAPGVEPGKILHIALCDDGSDLGAPNPRPCDDSSTTTRTAADVNDCYDLTIISALTQAGRLWGTPVTVRIESPKTVSARIVDVAYGTPERSPSDITHFEPSVTADGRLLFTHGIAVPTVGLLYSYIAPPGSPAEQDPDWPWVSGSACDITKWETFLPISSLHADPYLDAYPVARYPIRDNFDHVFQPGEVVEGAYPWIDRDGVNLAFAHGGGTLAYIDDGSGATETKYPVVGGTDPVAGFDSNVRLGRAFAGLWTHGKIVNLDGRLNPTDFGIEGAQYHQVVRLYQDDLAQPVDVEVGTSIAHLISSTESRFYYLPRLRPSLPRDVVWHVSMGTADVMTTAEVAFDDYLFSAAYIVSYMNPAIDNATRAIQDGFELTTQPFNGFLNQGRGFTRPPLLENSATAVSREAAEMSRFADLTDAMWEVPPYGKVLGGARAEPVTAGGISGRGLWLDGVDDRLEYQVSHAAGPTPGRSRFRYGSWLYTLALDARALVPDSDERVLTLPDGTWLDLRIDVGGAQSLRFGREGAVVSVPIPAGLELVPREWGHLAIVSEPTTPGDYRTSVYWGGFLLHVEEPASVDMFRMRTGLLRVGWVPGSGTPGFRGWIDELKVIAHRPNAEEVCNHAQGTLVRTENVGTGRLLELFQLASLYDVGGQPGPGWVELEALVGAAPGDKFACERKTNEPQSGFHACYGWLERPSWNPRAHRCLRDEVHGGTSYFDVPRADSTDNDFCRTCHAEVLAPPSLDVATALAPGAVPVPQDPRRQPFQHAPRLYGRIPASHFEAGPWAALFGLPGADEPVVDTNAGDPYEDGAPIDRYTLPDQP